MHFNYTTFIKSFCAILCALTFFNKKVAAQPELPGSGKCLQLDGIDDYLVAGQSNRGITNKITIEAWVKTSSLSLSWVAGKYSNSLGEDAGYEFFVTNGYAALYGRDGSGNYRFSGLSSTFVADNQWHHIAGVVNNGIWEVWVDGNLENRLETYYDKVNLTTEKANFCVGVYQEFNAHYFKGNIDEVRVWNSARTEEQIRENMCVKLTGTEPNLVGYYKFDEIPGNTGFKDYSTNKINAQPVNASVNTLQEISGAPLGDAAENFYKPAHNGSWTTDIAEFTGGNFLSFQVAKVSTNVKGVHIYRVENSPNTLNGLTGTTPLKYYYGVYTVNGSNSPVTYTVNQKASSGNNCYALFKRESNAGLTWNLQVTRFEPATSLVIKTNEAYRGEYILNSAIIPPVKVIGSTNICPDSSTTLHANTTGATKFLWSTGENTSSITVKKEGWYSVKAYSTNDCYSEDSVNITFNSGPECRPVMAEIIIPNIITPNGDNLNEVFFIKHLEQRKWLLKVFNRWGNLVYVTTDYKNDWDAKDVSGGIYYYNLNSTDNTRNYKGYLEVLK